MIEGYTPGYRTRGRQRRRRREDKANGRGYTSLQCGSKICRGQKTMERRPPFNWRTALDNDEHSLAYMMAISWKCTGFGMTCHQPVDNTGTVPEKTKDYNFV